MDFLLPFSCGIVSLSSFEIEPDASLAAGDGRSLAAFLQ